MADAPKPPARKSKATTYALYGVGALAVGLGGWWLYKRYVSAAAASTTGTGTTSGTDTSNTTPPSTSTPTVPKTFAQWQQEVVSAYSSEAGGGGTAGAITAINDWLSGKAINSGEAKALSEALTEIGLPPGYIAGKNLPPIIVKSSEPKKTTTHTASEAPTAAEKKLVAEAGGTPATRLNNVANGLFKGRTAPAGHAPGIVRAPKSVKPGTRIKALPKAKN